MGHPAPQVDTQLTKSRQNNQTLESIWDSDKWVEAPSGIPGNTGNSSRQIGSKSCVISSQVSQAELGVQRERDHC